MNADPKIENYLRSVRSNLKSVTAGEEEKVALAVTSRILVIASKPGKTVESAIEELGPAKKVATQYRDKYLIAKASESWSPALLLQASLRNGVPGKIAFAVGLILYWIGGFAFVFGVLSLLWSVVHFVPQGQITIGSSVVELVKPLVAGAIVLVVVTLVLRVMLRRTQRTNAQL